MEYNIEKTTEYQIFQERIEMLRRYINLAANGILEHKDDLAAEKQKLTDMEECKEFLRKNGKIISIRELKNINTDMEKTRNEITKMEVGIAALEAAIIVNRNSLILTMQNMQVFINRNRRGVILPMIR